jgi:glycosyltransferase involved in cell wall biosynthesis
MKQDLTPQPPVASIVIPTCNRSQVLLRSLEALACQTYPAGQFEVIVVCDGCTDGTASLLRGYRTPFRLHVLEQPNRGPAAARNLGASRASGEWLIFLDDDIEAFPRLVEAHLSAHQAGSGVVILGYLPVMLPGKNNFFEIELRCWWEAMFQKMRQPGHRYAYTDLLSGNFSLEARLFTRVGGFDTGLRCHEDYELGMRLLQAGARFQYVEAAAGFHYEATTLDRSLKRKYAEGIADISLGECYPELRAGLLLAKLQRYDLLPSRVLRFLAFRWPALGDRIVAFFQKSLGWLEKYRLRYLWRRILYGLLGYWYWRGAATILGSIRQVSCFLDFRPAKMREQALELDLFEGLEAAEGVLDLRRPDAARLRFRSRQVGMIPAEPGGEPLRGAHLRPLLAQNLAAPLLKALVLEEALGFPELSGKILAACEKALLEHPELPERLV